jgi:hypothetical protein
MTDHRQIYSHPWLTGHHKIYITCDFPTFAADWTPEFAQTLLAGGGNTFNTNRMSSSLSRWPFGVTAPNLVHMPRLLDDSTTFLVGFSGRPDLANTRIMCHVSYSDSWGRVVNNSFTVVITNSRASSCNYSDIETEELLADALSGLPALAGKCANLRKCFGAHVEDVPCQAPSTLYIVLPINVVGESNIVTAPRGIRNISHQLRLKGQDAYTLGTDARSLGSDAHTHGTALYATGTDAYSTGTAEPNGRAANHAVCQHCHHYHGRYYPACEASKAEKRNSKKRRVA